MNKGAKNSQKKNKKEFSKNSGKKIPDEIILEEKTEILKAISDITRLKILFLLKNGEMCSCNIETELNKPQPTISHHINILRKSKIIQGRKEGTLNYYSISNPIVLDILDRII